MRSSDEGTGGENLRFLRMTLLIEQVVDFGVMVLLRDLGLTEPKAEGRSKTSRPLKAY